MDGIVPDSSRNDKRRLRRRARATRDPKLATRYLIIVNLAEGRSAADTARALGVARSSVFRTARRFRECGEAGRIDRREDNGDRKLDACYLSTLWEVVDSSPLDHGWKRPTCTR